jgi:uncharacterized protein
MFKRFVENQLINRLGSNKAILLLGPRQVGKTTLIENVLEHLDPLILNGDDQSDRALLENVNTAQLKQLIGNYKYLFIDEAQRIENIGLTLKIIIDKIKTVQVIVSGSSSFDLHNSVNEPLTGRKWEYNLFPLAWQEFEDYIGYAAAQQQLELRLVYGMYPDVINHVGDEYEILNNLVSSYLYKDILTIGGIKRPELLDKILRALAYQVGYEVSYNELAQLVGADKNTVNNYIDLLCKTFVLFKVPSYSRNLRNEIKFNQKIYFYDNGVRNIIIGNLDPLIIRNDVGPLWENFLMAERLKGNVYSQSLAKMFFWRTTTQKEIDFVEDRGGKIAGYEFKWNHKKKTKLHQDFMQAYNATIETISKENFRSFLKF